MPRRTSVTPVSFWENRGLMMFKPENGYDFISPAAQDVVRHMGSPLWEPTFASRCDYPMWDRPDIFRTITYRDMLHMDFTSPKITFPSGVVQPSGIVSLQNVERSDNVLMSDKELYHYDVQKVFSLFSQFDTLLADQVSAFTGLSIQRSMECLTTLWSFGALERSTDKWKHFDTLGYVWRMNRSSLSLRAYVNGMDNIPRVLTVGNSDIADNPPGSGTRTSLKHNLFTAEILLRVAESCDNVVGVWGDSFVSEKLFHEHDPNAEVIRRSHADGAIVTKDGSVILVETVGDIGSNKIANQSLIDKAASWVGVIANSPLDVYVVFVDTTFYNSVRTTHNSLDIAFRKESRKFAPEQYSRERAISHVGVVGGSHWFPENGSMSRAGTRLLTYNPSTRRYRPFDIPDVDFSTSERRRNVVVNTLTALHTPPWILENIKERNYAVS